MMDVMGGDSMSYLNINESKKLVKDAIDKQKNKVISELDEISKKVSNSNLISEIVGELVEVYGNTNQQREVMIDIMRTTPSNHFKLATVKGKMNAINFEHNGITFSISTSRIRKIEISISEIEKPVEPNKEAYKTYSSYEVDFLETWAGKLSKLDSTTDKKLIESYFNVRNRRGVPFLYTRKLRKENYEKIRMYLEDIRKRMNVYKREKQEIEEMYNEYEVETEKYNELFSEMESNFKIFIEENNCIMEDFKGKSWRIEFIDIPDEWMKDINV